MMEPQRNEVRRELERVSADVMAHWRAGTINAADTIMEVETTRYTNQDRHEREIATIFRRVPLMLAASGEIAAAGDFKAMEVAGVPVLLVRDKEGKARAFVNSCRHRGAMMAEGCGHASRFVCPYHGWTYSLSGDLLGITAREEFGEIVKSDLRLNELPALEKAGMIWVTLNPDSRLDIETYLAAFGDGLTLFDAERWTIVDRREMHSRSNWKLAFEAHLDWYHLPVLHRESFGPDVSNKALFYEYGPHQRMIRPAPEPRYIPPELELFNYVDRPASEWPVEAMLTGGWISFPNHSLYTMYVDGVRHIQMNQIFPGASHDESTTVQYLLSERPGSRDDLEPSRKMCDFLEHVVEVEDLQNSARQQRCLASGVTGKLVFGRNEAGIQNHLLWVERLMAASDAELERLFADASRGAAAPAPADTRGAVRESA